MIANDAPLPNPEIFPGWRVSRSRIVASRPYTNTLSAAENRSGSILSSPPFQEAQTIASASCGQASRSDACQAGARTGSALADLRSTGTPARRHPMAGNRPTPGMFPADSTTAKPGATHDPPPFGSPARCGSAAVEPGAEAVRPHQSRSFRFVTAPKRRSSPASTTGTVYPVTRASSPVTGLPGDQRSAAALNPAALSSTVSVRSDSPAFVRASIQS